MAGFPPFEFLEAGCFYELVEGGQEVNCADGPTSDGAKRRASADALAVMPTDPIMTKDAAQQTAGRPASIGSSLLQVDSRAVRG